MVHATVKFPLATARLRVFLLLILMMVFSLGFVLGTFFSIRDVIAILTSRKMLMCAIAVFNVIDLIWTSGDETFERTNKMFPYTVASFVFFVFVMDSPPQIPLRNFAFGIINAFYVYGSLSKIAEPERLSNNVVIANVVSTLVAVCGLLLPSKLFVYCFCVIPAIHITAAYFPNISSDKKAACIFCIFVTLVLVVQILALSLLL